MIETSVNKVNKLTYNIVQNKGAPPADGSPAAESVPPPAEGITIILNAIIYYEGGIKIYVSRIIM
jgi:hypothetical protein